MRYVSALGISGIILAALLGCHFWVGSMVSAMAERAHAHARLPRGLPPTDIGLRVSNTQLLCIQLDQILVRYGIVLVPLLILICLCLAGLLPRAGIRPNTASSDTELT